MLKMERTGPGEARLLEDGAAVGTARWEMRALCWPGERIRLAHVEEFQAPAELREDFWAYLRFLFQRDGAAAAQLDGTLFWFSPALKKSWEALG